MMAVIGVVVVVAVGGGSGAIAATVFVSVFHFKVSFFIARIFFPISVL